MVKRFSTVLVLVIVLVVGVFSAYYVYTHRQDDTGDTSNEVNYLIEGVSYYGFYNNFFKLRHSSLYSSIFDVLGFWGDERFSFTETMEIFNQPDQEFKSQLVAKFFENNGYEIFFEPLSLNGGEAIEQIKKFVNEESKIPVIVYQKLSDDPERISVGLRVVIGVFDDEKKLIAHDHNFGNNYEITYDVFEKMLHGDHVSKILAVWPSDDLKTKISGPDYSLPYPERLAVMDRVGELLVKYTDAEYTRLIKGDTEKAIQLYVDVFNDPKINEFPRAHIIQLYMSLGEAYLLAKQPDNAIRLVNEAVSPINDNIEQPFGEWEEHTAIYSFVNQTKSGGPACLLGRAYLMKGDKITAKKYLEEAIEISPTYDLPKRVLEEI